jgi:phosphate transport system substrate-binding protein
VNPALPDQDILAFVPGTKPGTHKVFDKRVIEAGCEESDAQQAFAASGLDEDGVEAACTTLRTDGRSVDIDYTETLARPDTDPNGLGVFGLSFHENDTDKLQVATMSGVTPLDRDRRIGRLPRRAPALFLRQDRASPLRPRRGLRAGLTSLGSTDPAHTRPGGCVVPGSPDGGPSIPPVATP